METFEDRLSGRLAAVVRGLEAGPDLDTLVQARVARRRRRRHAGVAVTVAAAVALVAGAVVGLASVGGGGVNVATTGPHATPPPLAGSAWSWTALPPAPIAARSEYTSVWTGTEMIVWGGYAGRQNFNDGAAYDPTTEQWTVLPPSPLLAVSGPLSVWTGTEMLIFGGGSDTPIDQGAAYDPTTDTWRTLAPIPAALGDDVTTSGSYAVWTGSEMLVWGFFGDGSGTHGGGSLDAAAYDPSTNAWTVLTAAPVQTPMFGTAVWTGTEMIVWGQDNVPDVAGASHLEGVSFDPATGAWAVLPPSPLQGGGARAGSLAVWTGSELVVGGGESGESQVYQDAAAYDPATNSWQSLPDAPVGFTAGGFGGGSEVGGLWTGSEVLDVINTAGAGQALLFDPATETWSLGPADPVAGRQETDPVWTGTAALVWGGGTGTTYPNGNSSCCSASGAGEAFAPATS